MEKVYSILMSTHAWKGESRVESTGKTMIGFLVLRGDMFCYVFGVQMHHVIYCLLLFTTQ